MAIQRAATVRVTRDSAILGGEPVIAGTRVPVASVILALRYKGSAEAVLRGYPTLDPDAITAALDYYENHRSEIDRYIAEDQDRSEWEDERKT